MKRPGAAATGSAGATSTTPTLHVATDSDDVAAIQRAAIAKARIVDDVTAGWRYAGCAMSPQKQRLDLFAGTLPLAFVRQGVGRPVVLLHGGAGADSMTGLAGGLAERHCTVLPTHPGFDGEPRPERFGRISDLVLAYLTLFERLNLSELVLVGNSMGGWLAAELALSKSPRIAGLVLLDAVGIDTGSPDVTIPDPATHAPDWLLARTFHDPKRFAMFATPPSPEAAATLAENQRTLRIYAGEPFMYDPGLRACLAGMSVPTLVVWGESDGLVTLDYGRRYAASIPGARFEVVPMAGHLPQMERLEDTRRLVEEFAAIV